MYATPDINKNDIPTIKEIDKRNKTYVAKERTKRVKYK